MSTAFLFRLARAGIVVVLVVLGGVFAAAFGHQVVVAAGRSLDAASANATAAVSALAAGSSATADSGPSVSGQASSPGAPTSAASSASLTASAPSGVSAARLVSLRGQVAAVARQYAAVAPHEQVAQFCHTEVDDGALHANLRATVKAQLPAADQGLSDAQLDLLLDDAARALC